MVYLTITLVYVLGITITVFKYGLTNYQVVFRLSMASVILGIRSPRFCVCNTEKMGGPGEKSIAKLSVFSSLH